MSLFPLNRLRQANRALRRALEECRAESAARERSIQQYQQTVADHDQSIEMYQQIVAAQEAHLRVVDTLDDLKRQLAADSEATAELTALQSRTVAIMHTKLDGIAQMTADLAAKSYVHRKLDELGEGAAELLNYANGDRGFAAQAGIWFDWPIRATFRAGQASITEVNERIVNVPFALGALASLEPGSLILDVGATGSFLPLSLACLGHEVIALDRRPYPLEHPRLSAVVETIVSWSGPDRLLDAVVCLSVPADTELDRGVLDRFRQWLRPGGLLVLSMPPGAGVSGDSSDLLAGWQILDQRLAVQTAPLQWTIVEGEPTPAAGTSGGRAVALIRATPAS